MKKIFMMLLACMTASCLAAQETSKVEPPSSPVRVPVDKEQWEKSLPSQAAQWLEMIKASNPSLNCAQHQDIRQCVFVSVAQLNAHGSGINLVLKGHSFIKSLLPLPSLNNETNAQRVWPRSILLNGSPAIVVEKDNIPFMQIAEGDFEISLSLPEMQNITTIDMPVPAVILQNNLKSQNVVKEGSIIRWVNSSGEATNSPALDNKNAQVIVYRKLQSSIPSLLSTKLKITYSGENKDFHLGKVLPEGFAFIQSFSSLHLEKREDGFWTKLVPGEHEIDIEAYMLKDVSSFNAQQLVEGVKSEVWSIEQLAHIRQIQTSGAQQVDPKQALVPSQWQSYPAYVVNETIELKTISQGMEISPQVKLAIQRKSWFGFEGSKMIHLDQLDVTNQGLQLLQQQDATIAWQSFEINQNKQVLIKDKQSSAVAIPEGDFKAQAQSTTQGATLPLSFWQGENNIVQWTINLAPRLRLLAITGPVQSDGSWVDSWNLYKAFSVFLISLAFYKMFGRFMGILSLIGLISFQATQSFSWGLWISLLGLLSLLRVLPYYTQSRLARVVRICGLILFSCFAINAISFIKLEMQYIINPSLEAQEGMSLINQPAQRLSRFNVFKWFGVESNRPSGEGLQSLQDIPDRALSEMAPAPSYKSEAISQEKARESVLSRKVQVGSGIPQWSNNELNANASLKAPVAAKEHIKLWIVPAWLVNLAALLQICLLVVAMTVFAIALLYFHEKSHWIERLPIGVRQHSMFKLVFSTRVKESA